MYAMMQLKKLILFLNVRLSNSTSLHQNELPCVNCEQNAQWHCSAFTEIKNFPLRLEGEKKQRTETEQDTGQLARE